MVEMRNITKIFGTLRANDQVSLHVKKGEIHALLGENGAGKSTLMSILFGLYQPEEGEIFVNGNKVLINNPNDANQLGIGMVHQHFKLVDTFTVLENIVLGAEDTKNGLLTLVEARKKVEDISKRYGLGVDLDALISDITVGQQQRVEIIKMLYRDANILIFDEPTAVLTPQEIKELIGIMKGFAKEGKTLVLITHKLNEIKEAADRCTVLRRGKMVGTVDVKKTTTKEMAEMMVGRSLNFEVEKADQKPKDVVLELKDVTLSGKTKDILTNISFQVRQGEILGIAGIDGNGQTELVQVISGLMPFTSGQVILNDTDISKASIRKRYELGLSHIPEDRQKHGLILDFNLAYNLFLQEFYKTEFQKYGFLKMESIYKHAEGLIERFDIRSANDAKTLMRSMSGGNQQKAIIAREIDRNHNVLVAVQPTRGLDVGAIEYIHKQLIAERDQYKGVLLVSLELDEILDVSDRILVIYEGEIVGEFDAKDTNANELGLYMSGSAKGSDQA
jgi:general nucleoside transport system ATP-binding protein